ncbi:longitudinals lacking protein, isoforms H/M/V isoform X9 [Drosophila obscura]|uniref:longitudinals lacking protein, isoforms H/M/V isoform X9 n=1 Tax=Drosophila obscura TaxID=7282 RepID=UPI001BB0E95B|nr:longitudinals lacking protein, isoforms H/M/V isoform X9 [Drosophila obscura]
MDDDQQFCLRWNNHQSTLISVFDTLLENETLVDCTLAAEGKFLKAHKVVLSACSPYFATLLQEQYDKHPIFILKDVKYQELRAMMDYMYRGEVNISQDQLAALLKAAESLQIKGLSDNRTGGGSAAAAPKPESSQHHRGGKMSGAYTLEQTKRARLATGGAMDTSGDVSGSREGSSSPSRRRRKVRRRSLENDAHDNSNSSVLQAAASNQSILQQTSAGLAVSALVSTQLSGGGSNAAGTSQVPTQQPLTSTNVTKKTESAKLTSSTAAPAHAATATAAGQQQQQQTSDAINTENVQPQSQGAQGDVGDAEEMEEVSAASGGITPAASGAGASAGVVHTGVVVKQLSAVVDKSSSNHKQKVKDNSVSSVGSEMVIEPKAEYDDDTHDENVEDLTLDEEDMTMEELDQTAGTSQGGEGSSQTYATWQHDRSQDELGLMAQDAQQRDPQDVSTNTVVLPHYSIYYYSKTTTYYSNTTLCEAAGRSYLGLAWGQPHTSVLATCSDRNAKEKSVTYSIIYYIYYLFYTYIFYDIYIFVLCKLSPRIVFFLSGFQLDLPTHTHPHIPVQCDSELKAIHIIIEDHLDWLSVLFRTVFVPCKSMLHTYLVYLSTSLSLSHSLALVLSCVSAFCGVSVCVACESPLCAVCSAKLFFPQISLSLILHLALLLYLIMYLCVFRRKILNKNKFI